MVAPLGGECSEAERLCGSRLVEEVARCRGEELRRVAYRLTHDSEEALDLLQDALERALHLSAELSPAALFAWLITVMRNLLTDRYRQARTRLFGLRTLRRCGELSADGSDDADDTPPPSSRITYDNVAKAMKELESPFREVFELHVGNLSLAQIAAALRIPVATAGTRLFRARRKLRAILVAAIELETPTRKLGLSRGVGPAIVVPIGPRN